MCMEVLCVQYKNNTYVANEKVTWHLSFYYKYFIKIVATFSVLIELDFIYSHDKNKEKIKKTLAENSTLFCQSKQKRRKHHFDPYIFGSWLI